MEFQNIQKHLTPKGLIAGSSAKHVLTGLIPLIREKALLSVLAVPLTVKGRKPFITMDIKPRGRIR